MLTQVTDTFNNKKILETQHNIQSQSTYTLPFESLEGTTDYVTIMHLHDTGINEIKG